MRYEVWYDGYDEDTHEIVEDFMQVFDTKEDANKFADALKETKSGFRIEILEEK